MNLVLVPLRSCSPSLTRCLQKPPLSTAADGRAAGAEGRAAAAAARVARPNSAALSSILRSDRRTNIRMDREQFDGAQTRLRKLAPEGREVADNFRYAAPRRTAPRRRLSMCVHAQRARGVVFFKQSVAG